MIKIECKDGKKPLEIEAQIVLEAVQYAVKNRLDLRWADFSGADLREANLRGADFSGANLSWADLSEANLRGVDIDFSCWPLWCGSLNVKIDKRIFCQLLYHTLRAGQSVDDPEVKKLFEIPAVVNLANQFHLMRGIFRVER